MPRAGMLRELRGEEHPTPSKISPLGVKGVGESGCTASLPVLVGAVITFNVALGGMKGITLVQAFQYWMKMFAISVPVFVLMAVFGSYGGHIAETGAPGSPAVNVQAIERKALVEKAPPDAAWGSRPIP